MAGKKRPTDEATQYAHDVVKGKIVAGEYVRLACERHLRDLKEGKKRGLSWSAESAQDAIEFFPAMLTITEGAKEGEPFTLLPWHVFVVGSLFGWKNKEGFLRFRFGWLETGKGQAKSPLMAAIGIYLQAFYGKKRAEIYCIGETKDTAKVMFRDAAAMVRGPIPGKDGLTLEECGFVLRGSGDLTYKIEYPATNSIMVPVANNDSISGPKPILVCGDEIHEMKTNKGVETWKAAVGKKHGDSIMLLGTNTPSIDQTVGTDYSEVCQKVLRGEFSDDSLFAYIARVDKEDDPFKDESCWVKALPALGITYPITNVRALVETAKHQISTALTTKRLYFGIPVGSSGFWTSEKVWEECKGEVVDAGAKGRLHLALDLSVKNDLTALSGCWEGETLRVKTWYWTREYEIEERTTQDHIPYRELEASGELHVCAGRVIDYSFVAKQIVDLCGAHGVAQMAVDSAHMEKLLDAFQAMGFSYWVYEGPDEPQGVGLKIVRHKQGKQVGFEIRKEQKPGEAAVQSKFLYMPTSINQLEDHMLNGTVVIDSNRLTTICASNAVVDQDAMANKMFDKNRSRGRIDGLVTTAMAVGAATSAMEARPAYAGNLAVII